MLTLEQKTKVSQILTQHYKNAISKATPSQRKDIKTFVTTDDAGLFKIDGIPVNFHSAQVLKVIHSMKIDDPLYPQELKDIKSKSVDASFKDIKAELTALILMRTPSPDAGKYKFLTLNVLPEGHKEDEEDKEQDEEDEEQDHGAHFPMS